MRHAEGMRARGVSTGHGRKRRRGARKKRRSPPSPGAAPARRWSQRVTRTSNALDLEPGVFTLDTPEAVARSLRRSAEDSVRRKAPAFRSAMSMLVFYLNRAGKNLAPQRRRVLEAAKDELRKLYGKTGRATARRAATRGTR